MRKTVLLLLLPLTACSAGSSSVVGTVFSPNPDVVTCPTKDLLEKITRYADEKDETHYRSMLLEGGGLCTTLPAIATLQVAEASGKMIRVRPERSPNARGVWTSRDILKKPH